MRGTCRAPTINLFLPTKQGGRHLGFLTNIGEIIVVIDRIGSYLQGGSLPVGCIIRQEIVEPATYRLEVNSGFEVTGPLEIVKILKKRISFGRGDIWSGWVGYALR